MRISRLKIGLLVLCCIAVGFEIWHFRSAPDRARQLPSPVAPKNKPDFVLLPANEVTSFARFFAGPNVKIEGWEPTMGDMNNVEGSLSQISELSKKDPTRPINNPAEYFRQYGAVVIDGRRFFVLNAFCSIEQAHASDWRNRLIIVLDGGKCYWRALFDVSRQRFTALSVNGVA